MLKVFIDGSSGTTGLRIRERLSRDPSVSLMEIPEDLRKDTEAKKEYINTCDVAFLCLPDDAARESVSLVENPSVKLIDTSTAHRVSEDFTYGLPEIRGFRERIRKSRFVANPGCHASGFIALVRPLTETGILAKDAFVSATSLTGYSGGGKKMIAEYESDQHSGLLQAPRVYGLTQSHKHLNEMAAYTGLSVKPGFFPIVAPFYSGMEVMISLWQGALAISAEKLPEVYEEYYRGENVIRFCGGFSENGFLSAGALSGSDRMEIYAHGCGERVSLIARFDNLGKGASGAAIQNMNIMTGRPETEGLVI